MQSIGLPAL